MFSLALLINFALLSTNLTLCLPGSVIFVQFHLKHGVFLHCSTGVYCYHMLCHDDLDWNLIPKMLLLGYDLMVLIGQRASISLCKSRVNFVYLIFFSSQVASSALGIGPQTAMHLAERLYTQGFIRFQKWTLKQCYILLWILSYVMWEMLVYQKPYWSQCGLICSMKWCMTFPYFLVSFLYE